MVRTYEETHPWINFSLNMSKFHHQHWMMLGEIGSKLEHIAGVPLAPRVAQKMLQIYLAKGAAATTAIEGNTLSEEEVERIISGDLVLPKSQQYLAQEIDNIVDAFNLITDKIHNDGPARLTPEFLMDLNERVLEDLELDDEILPGQLRKHGVVVGRYRCAPAEDCAFLLEKLCDVLNSFPEPEEYRQAMAVVKAAFAHLYFVWIHPFGDGNGRTARLLEVYILLCAGVSQPAGHLLSNFYNKTRQQYYEKLDAAVRGDDNVIEFIRYSCTGFVEGLREQIGEIRQHQWNVSWINYVHEQFVEKDSPADARRRRLVIALSNSENPVPRSKLRTLTPELAVDYAGKTPRTVTRDINILIEMDLISLAKGGWRARKDSILAFLPWRNIDI